MKNSLVYGWRSACEPFDEILRRDRRLRFPLDRGEHYPGCGVYFLLAEEECVYVGQSRMIGWRLADHKRRFKDLVTHVIIIAAQRADLDDLEQFYIDAISPRFNVMGRPRQCS